MKSKLDLARDRINEIDEKMADLFAARMKAVETVAEHKKECGLPIADHGREEEVLARGEKMMPTEEYKEYYRSFQKNVIAVSKEYQRRLYEGKESHKYFSDLIISNPILHFSL